MDRLAILGTMWMPDDCLGNYRNVFQYQQLHDAWAEGHAMTTEQAIAYALEKA